MDTSAKVFIIFLLIIKLLKWYICAFRYLFGKEVGGIAYVVFGFIDKNKENNNKHSFQDSIHHVVVSIFPSRSSHNLIRIYR